MTLITLLKKTLYSVFFFFIISSGNVFADETDDLLNRADELKSSSRTEFIQLLERIKPNFDGLSIEQKYFYIYLTGYRYSYEGQIEQGIKSYTHVFENSQNINLRHRAAISLINVYALNREWLSGFKYLDYISEISDKINDTTIRQNSWIAAGIFYNEVELYDLALYSVKKLKSEGVSGRNLCFTLAIELKAQVYKATSLLEDSRFNDAVEHCQSLNEKIVANVIATYWSQNLLNNKFYAKAVENLMSKITEIESLKYRLLLLDTYSLLAESYYNLKEFKLAKEYGKKLAQENKDVSYINPITKGTKILYLVAISDKDYQGAVQYLEELQEAQNIQYEEKKAKQLATEMARYQAIEKDNQIALLNKQNQILQLEKELTQETAIFNRWLISLLTFVAIILILWLLYVKRSQQRLRFLAEFDSLTKISNRAHFTQNAEEVLSFFDNSERTASLILFDLDNFKKINDTNGHLVGDEVLRLTADACKSCIRKVDIFGRVGGEEFAILLPGCEHEQAMKIAEDCRQKVHEIDTRLIGHEFEVSASFGVTDTTASGYELKDLLANADEAMYLAKRRGRNRVVQHKKED